MSWQNDINLKHYLAVRIAYTVAITCDISASQKSI